VGGISVNGTTKLYLFSENLKKKKYVDLLKKRRTDMGNSFHMDSFSNTMDISVTNQI